MVNDIAGTTPDAAVSLALSVVLAATAAAATKATIAT
jgi:hypothetical protein